jgi:sulfoxide reductase heme-binding subunit YedZ
LSLGINLGKEISNKKASGKQFYISYFVIASIVALILYALFQKPEEAVKMIYRAAGTLGYLFIFLTIVSSE